MGKSRHYIISIIVSTLLLIPNIAVITLYLTTTQIHPFLAALSTTAIMILTNGLIDAYQLNKLEKQMDRLGQIIERRNNE